MGTQSKKVVVLGSNSFSGQDFIDLALDNPNYSVIGISRSAERPAHFLRYKSNPGLNRFRFVQLDLNRDSAELFKVLDREKPQYVVNFAAQSEVSPSWEFPEHWFETNTVALAKIVNHLRRQNYLERFMQISSPEAYGNCEGNYSEQTPDNPSTPYAASKSAADLLLSTYFKQFKFPLITIRATNVYGARQQLYKIVPRGVLFLLSGKKIDLHGGGEAVKSYIHIRDVSRGELIALEKGELGARYHFSPDQYVRVRDLVAQICILMGKSFEKETVSVAERPGQDAAYVIDSSKSRKFLNWAPSITLDEGLQEVASWIKENWEQVKNSPWEYIHKP